MIEYADDEVVPIKELVELYESVGWLLYAADPDALARAVDRSTLVITARQDDELIGLVRCLTDEVSVLLILEVLVRPEHQRHGVGTELVHRSLTTYSHIGRAIATTAGEDFQTTFARSLGFTPLPTGLVLER